MPDCEDATHIDEPRPRRGRTPSEVLFESQRYRLVQPLGRGGMGEVVAARDELMGREVAIKRLRAPAPTAHQIERFLREARILAPRPARSPLNHGDRRARSHPARGAVSS